MNMKKQHEIVIKRLYDRVNYVYQNFDNDKILKYELLQRTLSGYYYYENLYWYANKKFLHEDYDLVGEVFRTNKTKENFVTSIADKFGNCKRNLEHFMDICQIQYNNIDNEIHRETPNEECLPKFSFWWNNRLKTGDKMNCDALPVICDNILYKYDNKLGLQCPYIKLFDCNYRIDNENLNYEYWNGCIVIDIDYKKYISKNDIYPNPEKVYKDIIDYLVENYKELFYYGEMSRSLKGFHFIFYYKVPHRLDGYIFASVVTEMIIKEAFIKCGYMKVIYTDEVLDDCTKSICQGIFLTDYNSQFNKNCTGNYLYFYNAYKNDILEKVNSIKYNNKKNVPIKTEIKEKIENQYKDLKLNDILKAIENMNIDYINHHTRYACFIDIYNLLRLSNNYSEENLKTTWERFAEMIPKGNGHNTEYYKKVPYVGDWNKNKNKQQIKSPKSLIDLGLVL